MSHYYTVIQRVAALTTDVTNFEFDDVRTSLNLESVENVGSACCRMRICGKSLFFDWFQCRESQRAQI